MATIVHFDLSTNDLSRAKNFYEILFNWKCTKLPVPTNCHLIETKDLQGQNGVGGAMSKRENAQQTGITNFFGVAPIDDALKKAQELGGTIVQPKQTMSGWGYLAVCTDTENNLFGIFQEEEKSVQNAETSNIP